MAEVTLQEEAALVARDIIARIQPAELPVFRANAERYFVDPERALRPRDSSDEMLGFGVGEASVFLTPVVLAVVTEVLRYLVQEARDAARTETSGVIEAWVKRWFKRLRPGDELKDSPLSADQVKSVRSIAFERARQLRLSEQQSHLLADSIVGGLVTAPRRGDSDA